MAALLSTQSVAFSFFAIRYVHVGGAKKVSACSARSDETRKYSDASRFFFYASDNTRVPQVLKKTPIKAENGPKNKLVYYYSLSMQWYKFPYIKSIAYFMKRILLMVY